MWTVIDFIVSALILGPWNWLGIAVGLVCALVAYTTLPEAIRAPIGALLFFAGWVLVLVLGNAINRKK